MIQGDSILTFQQAKSKYGITTKDFIKKMYILFCIIWKICLEDQLFLL